MTTANPGVTSAANGADMAAFSPCSAALGPDGIHDGTSVLHPEE